MNTATPNPYLGVGLYSVPEAAHILRVRSVNLRRWASGYTWNHQGEPRTSNALFARDEPELAAKGILTFADLVELKLIAKFRSVGFSLQVIRNLAEHTARRFEVSHPFATCRFHTDGYRIFGEWATAAKISPSVARFLEEMPSGQGVFDDIASQFYRSLDYEGDLSVHYWPLGKQREVVLDPRRSFGQPILAESGVPTWTLYEIVRRGTSTVEEVALRYEIDARAVCAAVEYESSLRLPATPPA